MKIVLDNGAFLPIKAHRDDAGYDLRSPVDVEVPAGGSEVIDTGVHMALPKGFCGMLVSKSGLNFNHGMNSVGLIDSGYTGSIHVKLYNFSEKPYCVKRGDKISQLVIQTAADLPLVVVDALDDTERGVGGFGSTGA